MVEEAKEAQTDTSPVRLLAQAVVLPAVILLLVATFLSSRRSAEGVGRPDGVDTFAEVEACGYDLALNKAAEAVNGK